MDSALASMSGFEGVGSETDTLAETSFLARFFFEDLVSFWLGRLVLIAADMVTVSSVEKCRVQPCDVDERCWAQPGVVRACCEMKGG